MGTEMKIKEDLTFLRQRLENGEFIHFNTFSPDLVVLLDAFINNNQHSTEFDYDVIKEMIACCNIVYQNFSNDILLSDNDYDACVVLYRKHRNDLPIGATIHRNSVVKRFEQEFGQINLEKVFIEPVTVLDKSNSLYFDSLFNSPNIFENSHNFIDPVTFQNEPDPISKRLREAPHMYDELAGTLDKCKYVLNNDAVKAGVFTDPSVGIFERDFIGRHIQAGVVDPNFVNFITELKYDGVSLEAECSNRIISARMRGDVDNNKSTDLTSIFVDTPFPDAIEAGVKDNDTIGIQFEVIMTRENLIRYSELKGYDYKNSRTAVSGLLSSSDALKYKDLLTLVPLRTSIANTFNTRVEEIEFLKKYYTTGLSPKYIVVSGNYSIAMYELDRIVKEAYMIRPLMSFMFDGIVISYLDKNIIKTLGRSNHIDNYCVAIKFPPLKVLTTFRGYTYTVGQDGSITPMIHYDPVNFYGTTHDKSTGHSYKRFKDLDLAIGDPVYVTYTNDVMPYVSKAGDVEFKNNNPKEKFLDTCPSCGEKLEFKNDYENTIYCTNFECPSVKLKRTVNMIAKLGFNDIAEETVIKLGISSFTELMELNKDKLRSIGFGMITSDNIIDQIVKFKTTPIEDYKVVGSLGFTGMSDESWKLILRKFPLDELLKSNINKLTLELRDIKGIGEVKANTVIKELELFCKDLLYICGMKNLVKVSSLDIPLAVVRFSGVRDSNLEDILRKCGMDVNGDKPVTKDTDVLIVPDDPTYMSSKVVLAKKHGTVSIIPISIARLRAKEISRGEIPTGELMLA